MPESPNLTQQSLIKSEDQEILIGRLYVKIDYLKNARLRVPAFAGIANFGLLTLSTNAAFDRLSAIIFMSGFVLIGFVSVFALYVVKKSFDDNVERLADIYEMREIPRSYAEPAFAIWFLLFFLICLLSMLPAALTWAIKFT